MALTGTPLHPPARSCACTPPLQIYAVPQAACYTLYAKLRRERRKQGSRSNESTCSAPRAGGGDDADDAVAAPLPWFERREATEEAFDGNVAALFDMGFDPGRALPALMRTDNNLERAVEVLMGGDGIAPPADRVDENDIPPPPAHESDSKKAGEELESGQKMAAVASDFAEKSDELVSLPSSPCAVPLLP